MKKFLCVLMAALMLLSMVSCGGNTDNTGNTNNTNNQQDNGTNGNAGGDGETEVRQVLMGINSSQPPASFVDADGNIDGQNYVVMNLVDELLPQYEFVYEAVDQDALIMGLDSGKYAAAVGNFWHNEKREESYLFPEYPIGGGVEGIAVNKKYGPEADPPGGLRRYVRCVYPVQRGQSRHRPGL